MQTQWLRMGVGCVLFGLLMALLSCHEEPILPNSLIPNYCQIIRVELIDTTSRTTFSYEYDPSGNRTRSNDWRGNRTFVYDAAGEFAVSQQANGTTLTYQYEGEGSSKRISRISGGGLNYTYTYEGNMLKTYVAQEGNTTTTYTYANGKLTTVARPGETITVQNGRIVSRVVGNTSYAYTYNSENQLTQEEIKTPTERRVVSYTYDKNFAFHYSGLLMRGFPGGLPDGQPRSPADGQPGPGLDPPGESVLVNNLLTENTKLYRPATATSPVADRTLRYNHNYYDGYSLGYARSDGARAKYTYANCN